MHRTQSLGTLKAHSYYLQRDILLYLHNTHVPILTYTVCYHFLDVCRFSANHIGMYVCMYIGRY